MIEIKGARVNNLKNIDLSLPLNKLIVITGVSGSGKSSLAFDTLYAEGQRRYVESLNSYARQFLGRNNKPDCDYIQGIPPAIAIEQKVNTRNPRSTVGTSTEVYDYLKILFARLGKTFSPISGKEVRRDSVSDVVRFITSQPVGTRCLILSPVHDSSVALIMSKGYSRLEIGDDTITLTPELEIDADKLKDALIIVDRVVANNNQDNITRLADSINTAFFEGMGVLEVRVFAPDKTYTRHTFSDKFEADGMVFEVPSEQLFTFNSPIGACPRCEGFGKVIGIDPQLVVPNPALSVAQGGVAPWVGPKLGEWKTDFIQKASLLGFDVYKPYNQLDKDELNLLWHGNVPLSSAYNSKSVFGIDHFFKMAEDNQYKIQYRVLLARYRGKTLCPECEGTRLKKSAQYVKVAGKTITELVEMSLVKLFEWVSELQLDEHDAKVAERVLIEIKNRLRVLCEVGLGYLTLSRLSNTLSGGESQRINLATSLGSSLVGSLYILDEPSIGLHSADTQRLISVLKQLRDLGNTVVVVEHDEDIMRAADRIVDIGPEAGRLGGEVVFDGDYADLVKGDTLTTKYLTGSLKIELPKVRRPWTKCIKLSGMNQNNLKNANVAIPLNCLCVVTGVSGSGKSTMITRLLYPALQQHLGESVEERAGAMLPLEGDLNAIKHVEFVDQNPIGKSSRSNPATYLKAYDEVRKLMANQQLSKQNGYTTAHFSFNAKGGRCEMCGGEGKVHIEMQFMADIVLECEACGGKRFKDEILDVKFEGVDIYDILEMTINQAVEFFGKYKGTTEKKIVERLKTLQEVGLGYVKMGQSSSTLSGGESQRVKLASFLAQEHMEPTMFIFDEPTTGLHFNDINKLLKAFYRLIEAGHSIVVIEHNMDVIKCADWVIDMGPGAGDKGGNVVFEGTPENLAKCAVSKTGEFLKEKLN